MRSWGFDFFQWAEPGKENSLRILHCRTCKSLKIHQKKGKHFLQSLGLSELKATLNQASRFVTYFQKKKGSEKRHITENQYASPSVCWILGENYSENTSPSRLCILWTASGCSCTEELGPAMFLCCSSADLSKGEHQQQPPSPETQQLFQHHLRGPVTHLCQVTHSRHQPWAQSWVRTHQNRAQEFHHLPWRDLQISTPETCSFHIHPPAKGHHCVPTDFPHKLTQGLLLFFFFFLVCLFSAGGIAGIGLNTQLFLCGFQENICLCYISILPQSTKVDKWSFRNLLLN